MGKYENIYALNELTGVTNVIRSTGIHAPHIIVTGPEQTCLPQCNCMFHCTTTVLYKETHLVHT